MTTGLILLAVGLACGAVGGWSMHGLYRLRMEERVPAIPTIGDRVWNRLSSQEGVVVDVTQTGAGSLFFVKLPPRGEYYTESVEGLTHEQFLVWHTVLNGVPDLQGKVADELGAQS